MKRSVKKSSEKTKKTRPIYWFGIHINYIALPVAFISIIVGGLLVTQALETAHPYVLAAHDESGITHGMTSFGDATDPIGGNMETTTTHCIPRPSCLDATPKCLIAEPVGGWCQISGVPEPTHSADAPSQVPPQPGCFSGRQCTTIVCPSGTNADECFACKRTLVCPSEMPRPSITCTPRPPCPAGQECPLQSEGEGIHWCLQTPISSAPGQEERNSSTPAAHTNGIGSWWNNFLRTFFH